MPFGMGSKVFWGLVVVVLGMLLILLSSFFRDRSTSRVQPPVDQLTASPSPTTVSKTTLPRPTGGFLPTPLPRNMITSPATCSVSGTLRFVAENIYQTEGAKIVYRNVDDHSRFIFWKVSPDDGVLTVGPNIFSQLVLPNGERDIGISVNKPTEVKSYTLTASVTYGVIKSNGSEEIRESQCSGSATVIMPTAAQ